MLKRILATALAAAMIFGLANLALAASPFPDTAGVDNEAAIARLKALRIFQGDAGTGLFRPADPISRAEFTAAVVRMLGLEAAAGFVKMPTAYPDVTAAYEWAYGYINIARGRKLIEGYPDGTFQPGKDVTQAEALTILLRAAGYTNDLPGNWPLNYVMEGANIGVIETGFSPNVAATRTQVADLVNNTLDVNAVEKQTDAAGNFTKFKKELFTVYENAFSVPTGTSKASGKVTAYSTSNKTITVGTSAIGYIDGVTIIGKDTIAELDGQYVDVTLNKDGKAICVAVTTANEVVGPITAVDTINRKVTVGGAVYTVNSDAEIVKNGKVLDGTIAKKLSDVKDAESVLLIEDGKVYRIVASILDGTEAPLKGKNTVSVVGEIQYKVQIGTTWYVLDDDCIIVRNGAAAKFADLKLEDSVKFAVGSDGLLVHIDAYSLILEGYKLVSIKWTSTGRELNVEKEGVTNVYAINEKNYSSTSDSLVVGNQYNLSCDRNGKVILAKDFTPSGPTTGQAVKKVTGKNAYTSGSTIVYAFDLDDGTTLALKLTLATYVNGASMPVASAANLKAIWEDVPVGALVKVDETGAGVATAIRFNLASVTGRPYYDVADGALKIAYGTDYTKTMKVIAPLAVVKLNSKEIPAAWVGQTVGGSVFYALPATAQAAVTATMTFAGEYDVSDVPVCTTMAIEDFSTSTDATAVTTNVPVKSILAGTEYTYTLLGSTTSATITTDSTTVIGGAVETKSEVAIGHLVKYQNAFTVNTVTIPKYVKVSTDTTAPKITAGAKGGHDGTHQTVTLTVSEPVAYVYVWFDGTRSKISCDATQKDGTTAVTSDGKSWSIDIKAAAPTAVTFQAVDFAGNVSATFTP